MKATHACEKARDRDEGPRDEHGEQAPAIEQLVDAGMPRRRIADPIATLFENLLAKHAAKAVTGEITEDRRNHRDRGNGQLLRQAHGAAVVKLARFSRTARPARRPSTSVRRQRF